jgi:hypothetical protein
MKRSSVLVQSRQRRRKAWLRRILFWPGVALGFVVFTGGILVFAPFFRVQSVAIQGNAAITTDSLETVVRNMLNGKSKMILSNDNMFFLSTEGLEQAIQQAFPRIANIHVERSFPHGITITMEERHEWGIWCPGIALPTAATCYHINEESILLDPVDTLGEDVIFVDRRSNLPKAGDQMLPDGVFTMMKTMLVGLDGLAIKVQQIMLGDEGGHISIETQEGWKILVDDRTNAHSALENLGLLLEKELKNRADLEYVNLQFKDKVFYKRK